MNPQMASHQQAQYANPPSQHPQNFNQQKQTANTQQKGTQGQQQMHNSYGTFDPRITFWSLEKTKNADSWADVKPQQQHIPIEELEDELEKFKRKDLTVKRVLDEVKSVNCRKLINNLADDQTKELQKSNRTLKFTIGGVLLEKRQIDRRSKERVLIRVQVILQTVPSGIPETQFSKPIGANGIGNGNAQGAQSLKQPGMMQGQQQHGNIQGQSQGPNTTQQPRPQQGLPHMGQSQFDLPPPPPPGASQHIHGAANTRPPAQGGHQVPSHGGAPPPPPPPPGMGINHGQPNAQPNFRPEAVLSHGSAHMKMSTNDMRQAPPYIQTTGPQFMHNRKKKHKFPRGSSSDEDSNEWDTETGSSGSDSYRVRSVDGGFGLVDEGRRGRTKRSKNTKKTQLHKSHSRVRSRSVSKARQRQHTRRRDSDSSGIRSGRHSPASSKAKSSYHSSSDESRHGHKKHKHRARFGVSPTRAYNERVSEKYATSPTMSRHSSQRSWSDVTSSDHSGKHSRRDRGHGNARSRSNSRHRHSRSNRPKYDSLDERYNVREPLADDYPYENPLFRESATYRDVQVPTSRPPPPRRAATQVPFPNPFFANAATPLHQTRDSGYNTYAADLNASGYSIHSQPQRYTTAHSPVEQDRFAMNDIVDALYDRIAQNGEAQRTPPLGRHQAERRDGGFFDDEGAQRMPPLRRHQTERSIPVGIDDEWQRRYPSARGAVHGAYGRY
jgi:hypothetical protein